MIEPIAFGIESDGRLLASYTCEDEQSAREMAGRFAASGVSVAVLPLYRSPTLTDEEREAIDRACRAISSTMPYESQQGAEDYQTLRGLLKRLGG